MASSLIVNVRPGLAQIFMGALPMVVVNHPELARCGIALCEAVHVLSVIDRRMTYDNDDSMCE